MCEYVNSGAHYHLGLVLGGRYGLILVLGRLRGDGDPARCVSA